jgi:hypothetical protein
MTSGMHSSFATHNKKTSRPPPQDEDTVRQPATSSAASKQPSTVRPIVTPQSGAAYAVSGVRNRSGGDSQATHRPATGLTPLKIPSISSPASAMNAHLPFSPSAIASRSGKTIKAFFRHRHADADSDRPLESHVGLHASSSTSARNGSTQRKQDVVGLPSISVSVSPDLGLPSQSAPCTGPTDPRCISLKTSESKVRFPKVDGDDVPMHKAVEHEALKRKPRLSLSLFRSASKSKPLAKISPEHAADSSRDARIRPQSVRKSRPMSAPPPQRLSTPSNDARDVANNTAALLNESKTPQSRQALTPVKALRSSSDEKDPKPPDRDARAAMNLLPLTLPHSGITSQSADAISDPDRQAHYMLRMACTYLTKTILPEVKAARSSREAIQPSTTSPHPSRTASEKADALRQHVYDKIKLLERMERAWGID